MPAKQGVHKRLVTLTERNRPIMRASSKWRKLKPRDLNGKGDGLVLQVPCVLLIPRRSRCPRAHVTPPQNM
eukprot:6300731-Prymnesium_polylepis.2